MAMFTPCIFSNPSLTSFDSHSKILCHRGIDNGYAISAVPLPNNAIQSWHIQIIESGESISVFVGVIGSLNHKNTPCSLSHQSCGVFGISNGDGIVGGIVKNEMSERREWLEGVISLDPFSNTLSLKGDSMDNILNISPLSESLQNRYLYFHLKGNVSIILQVLQKTT
jgi:hypothetical protein